MSSNDWSSLPPEILVRIFRLLPLKNLGRCSQVCGHWNDVFCMDDSWRTFTFHDNLLVKRRFTQHSGWQYALDHMRLRHCVPMIIDKWRELIIEPVSNLFNLYEFMQKITNFSEFHERNLYEQNPLSRVRKFCFRWSLHVRDRGDGGEMEEKDIGTGGEVLRCIRALLSQLHGMQDLELHQLQLNTIDTMVLLEELLEQYQMKLRRLVVPNMSLFPNSALHLGLFLNLQYLELSPQNLSDSCVVLLGDLQRLRKLKIVQDERTTTAEACSSSAWKQFVRSNRGRTSLFLVLRGKSRVPLLLQPSAPVTTIVFERSAGQLTFDLAEKICEEYADSLQRFEQGGLERLKRSNRAEKRVDRAVVELTTRCRKLSLMAIRERISNGTALLLSAISSERGQKIYLRRNALLKRVSWGRKEITNFGIDFDWLKKTSKKQEETERELEILTGKMTLLTDKIYKDYFK